MNLPYAYTIDITGAKGKAYMGAYRFPSVQSRFNRGTPIRSKVTLHPNAPMPKKLHPNLGARARAEVMFCHPLRPLHTTHTYSPMGSMPPPLVHPSELVRRCGRSVDEDCGGGLDPPSTLKPQGFVDMTHTACTNRSHKAVVRFLPLSVYALAFTLSCPEC
jgi:hypothetical protein